MSFENATPIQIGMTCTLSGVQYQVAGRIVMGMEDSGETYYWNEFNLVKEDGTNATLVDELSEDGNMWRLFTMFEPVRAMSVEEASGVQVDDRVNLDGTPTRVSLVDESRVYFIEGQAPEGVEVGDVAHYFNAESANKMLVVSWTGPEVEYYRGVTIRAEIVGAAFGIHLDASRPPVLSAAESSWSSTESTGSGVPNPRVGRIISQVIFAGLFVMGLFSFRACHSPRRQWTTGIPTEYSQPVSPPTPVPVVEPKINLKVGASGELGGTNYSIVAHGEVYIGRVGALFTRHEYVLTDTNDHRLLLVYGERGGARDWTLLTPVLPDALLGPEAAAALHSGNHIKLDGADAEIGELFQSVVRTSDNFEAPELVTGKLNFGFVAHAGPAIFQARWDAAQVTFHRAQHLDNTSVLSAFAKPAEK